MMSDSSTAGQFKPLSKKTQSDQVVDILKEYISSDSIQVGEKLPPELNLAKMLQVSRATIREAIRTLSVLGYIEIVNGKGSYLRTKQMNLPLGQITAWFDDHKMELSDFIEVRKLIEPYAIGMAIERCTDEELQTLDELRLAYESEWVNGASPRLGEIDAQFHQQLIDMAHNVVLSNIYQVIAEAFVDFRRRSFAVQYHADNAIEPHRKIAAAVMERNAAEARKQIMAHLDKVYADMTFTKAYSDDK